MAEAESHFVPLYEDKNPGCKRPPPPKVNFNVSKLEREILKEAVRKKRGGNAPGINGIPFLVYKKCPKILGMLLEILNRALEAKSDTIKLAESYYCSSRQI